MNYDVLSNLIIKNVRSISTIYTEKNAGASRRNRTCWAILIKYEGETIYTSEGEKYISNINNVAILPKGSNYSWYCKEAGHFSVMEFECDEIYPHIFSFRIKNGDFFRKMIQKAELNRTLKKTGFHLDELSDLYHLIALLLKTAEQAYTPNDKKQKIFPAIEYIADNCNRSVRNEELASVTGLSVTYFRKLFKEVTGESPVQYIKSVKMNKARKMLQSDYSSISDIAYSLGYNNVYEFSRDFKKYMGISPLNYVKRCMN